MNASVSSRQRDDIPPHVLDQAIAWLVKLQSGTADAAIRQEDSQIRLRVENGAVALPAQASGSRVIVESG